MAVRAPIWVAVKLVSWVLAGQTGDLRRRRAGHPAPWLVALSAANWVQRWPCVRPLTSAAWAATWLVVSEATWVGVRGRHLGGGQAAELGQAQTAISVAVRPMMLSVETAATCSEATPRAAAWKSPAIWVAVRPNGGGAQRGDLAG